MEQQELRFQVVFKEQLICWSNIRPQANHSQKKAKEEVCSACFWYQLSAPSDLELKQSASEQHSCSHAQLLDLCIESPVLEESLCDDTLMTQSRHCRLLSSGMSEVAVLELEMRFPDRRLAGGSPRGNKKVVVGKQELLWSERAWDQREEAESAVLLQVGMEYSCSKQFE